MPTDTQRAPTPEELETVGDSIRELLKCLEHTTGETMLWSDGSDERSLDEILTQRDNERNALIIAIAKRVREAEGEKCGHGPKNLATARITDTMGRVRWGTICTYCRQIVADPDGGEVRAAEEGLCSRCHKPITDFRRLEPGDMTTAGYYLAASFPDFANPGEVYICDSCMWADPRYIKVYGPHFTTGGASDE